MLPLLLSLIPTLPAAPPTAALTEPGWCVIVGSPPYRALDKAQEKVARARKLGFERARVYDSRDFTDLRWGLLAAVAGVYPEKGPAKKAAEKLKKRQISAYARRCTPGEEGAAPIDEAKAGALPPTPTIATDKQIEGICFAYSPSLKAAACVVGRSGTQSGQHAAVEFPGWAKGQKVVLEESFDQFPEEAPPTAKQIKAIERQLRQGGFLSRALLPTPEKPPYTLEQAQKKVAEHDEPEAGSWETQRHTITLTCANGKKAKVYEEDIEGSTGVDVGELLIPREGLVFLEISPTWAYEGTYGGETKVEVVDLKKICGK